MILRRITRDQSFLERSTGARPKETNNSHVGVQYEVKKERGRDDEDEEKK